jgi:hypothetical protein
MADGDVKVWGFERIDTGEKRLCVRGRDAARILGVTVAELRRRGLPTLVTSEPGPEGVYFLLDELRAELQRQGQPAGVVELHDDGEHVDQGGEL